MTSRGNRSRSWAAFRMPTSRARRVRGATTFLTRGVVQYVGHCAAGGGMPGHRSCHGDVWVVVPVFNEERVIATVIEELRRVLPNVVCVDDGSSDASADEVLRTGAHLVRHPINMGQGAALQTGISYALLRPGARYFVTFDADGQHRVQDAAAMVAIAKADSVDVVLGSRFLAGGGEESGTEGSAGVPLLKRMILRSAACVGPSARRLKLTDSHNGLRVLSRPVARELRITMNGMAHASEIVSYLGRSRWTVREAPVCIRYTDYSRSKGQSLINGVNILFDLSVRQRGG